MLAVQRQESSMIPVLRGVKKFTVAEVAKRRGTTEQAVRLQCPKLFASETANLETPPEGGKAQWMISENAYPELAANQAALQPASDERFLTERHRRALDKRVAAVLGWKQVWDNRGRLTLQQAGEVYCRRLAAEGGLHISWQHLNRLEKAFDDAKGQGRNTRESLIDNRWLKKKGRDGADDRMLKEAEYLYLMPNRLSKTMCHELAEAKAREQDWARCSYETTSRYLREVTPAALRIKHRGGKKAFTDQAAAFIERTRRGLASLDKGNADHHLCDLWVEVEGKVNRETGEVQKRYMRPWITIIHDWASSKILAHKVYVHDPNTDVILLVLRQSTVKWGIFEEMLFDGGRDFASYALHGSTKKQRGRKLQIDNERINGACHALGMEVHTAQGYHGQSKICERLFGTFEGRCCKLFPSYCGNTPANRPDGLKGRLESGKAPTLEEFAQFVAEWVEVDYNSRPSHGEGMDGKSPNQVFEEKLVTKRTAPEETLDLLLQKQSRPVKVTQNGVTWDGLRYGQYELSLKPLLGKEVTLRVDPEDVSRVTVWTMEGRFICVALCNRQLPPNADPALVREAMREKRADRRAQLAYSETRLRIHDDLPERMLRIAAERNAAAAARNKPSDPLPPTSIIPVRSPLERDLPAVQRALEMTKPKSAAERAAAAKERAQVWKGFAAGMDENWEERKAKWAAEDEAESGSFTYTRRADGRDAYKGVPTLLELMGESDEERVA